MVCAAGHKCTSRLADGHEGLGAFCQPSVHLGAQHISKQPDVHAQGQDAPWEAASTMVMP